MAERSNLQAKLNAGIDAVRAGDKPTGRRLLQQVLTADPNNEVAWMWMASAVSSVAERRACLERALRINPNNMRAREALRRLELTGGEGHDDVAGSLPGARSEGGGGGRTIYLVLAALVLVAVLGAVIFSLVNSAGQPPSDAEVAQTQRAAFAPSSTPTRDPSTATLTPFFAVVVTLERDESALPATFTPTFTPTASDTPTPTITPFPLTTFRLLYTAYDSGSAQSALYQMLGDGSEDSGLQTGDGYRDIALSPDGRLVAFIRDFNEEDEPGGLARPQLFVAPANNPGEATRMTLMSGSEMDSPSWSPDGRQIVFRSNDGGDDDLYVVDAGGGEPRLLTSNEGVDKDPAWSPDGRWIAYASDQDTPTVRDVPGYTRIFLMNTDGGDPRRLSEGSGNDYSPAWSPDSRTIVFVSDRSGDSDLYLMDTTGAGETLITFDDGGAEDRDPAFTPDGRWIAFASNRETTAFQIYLVDVHGDQVVRVTNNERDVQSLNFYPGLPS